MSQGLAARVGCGVAGIAAGFMAVVSTLGQQSAPRRPDDIELRGMFARPAAMAHNSANPATPAKITLGERLFHDVRLSGNGRISCATCHDPKLGFADGSARSSSGASGRELRRHTPTLWNLAWTPLLMWDGRATSLEAQIALPVEHPDEMAGSLQRAATLLSSDAAMREAFSLAFPDAPDVSAGNLANAIAAYVRTLVSPPTRFDRWIGGEDAALSREEKAGWSIFAGKAKCVNCHTGFAFTDQSFHDIGLPTSDPGRGPIAGLKAVDHAFKTPTLRELAWTAPYMHDGSLATLDDVVQHYVGGGIARASRSRELPHRLELTGDERAALVAFLETLSSDAPPRPSDEGWVRRNAPTPQAAAFSTATTISQRGRQFSPDSIKLQRGASITIVNDDTRTHNIRIASPNLDFNSGAQEPGESVTLKLDRNGTFEAHCGIHPTMRLRIVVE